jgi:uncharacterized protein YjiS (DUF1127 family)
LSLIVNAERAQQNRFPFIVRDLRPDGLSGLWAEPAQWRGPGLPPPECALSPTLLFGAGHAVLASTRRMATDLLAALRPGAARTMAGDLLSVTGAPVAEWLQRNRAVLALGRMFDEGETDTEARRFLVAAQAVAAALARLELRVRYGPGRTVLELELRRALP